MSQVSNVVRPPEWGPEVIIARGASPRPCGVDPLPRAGEGERGLQAESRSLTRRHDLEVRGYNGDVFGAIRSQSGGCANGWLNTGEQREADSGMYYLRAL